MSLPTAPVNVYGSVPSPYTYPDVHSGTITWTDTNNGVVPYRVYRKVSGFTVNESWHSYADLPAGATTFTDDPLTPMNTYVYYVVAVNTDGESLRPSPTGVDDVFLRVRAED